MCHERLSNVKICFLFEGVRSCFKLTKTVFNIKDRDYYNQFRGQELEGLQTTKNDYDEVRQWRILLVVWVSNYENRQNYWTGLNGYWLKVFSSSQFKHWIVVGYLLNICLSTALYLIFQSLFERKMYSRTLPWHFC